MRTVLASVAIAAIVALLGAALMFHNIHYSVPALGAQPAEVRVERGDSLSTVSRKLREQKIITNSLFFSLWARFNGSEKKLHQGLYRFDSGVTAREVLERLVSGKGIFQSVTIPEGFTVREIAQLLDKMQIADGQKFLTEAANPSLLANLGLQGKGIEGYLFPSTYHFTPATAEREIVITMAEQFRKVSQPLLAEAKGTSSMTAHGILTLASIIEKETGVEAERPLVSAVFHNRLNRQMPLQSDPTVIYGIKDFNGNLTKKDLQEATPYNTYRIPALPPGPICNPSVASIKAALHPAAVPYLYFVSKNDGSHLFSETMEAHNRAVKTFQPVRHGPPTSAKMTARH
ncbi:MAG: endolytic transglycosylase MltG [Deltaproteobacteria bacterium]|nr:endolytic transglycosylase MltG [Deltaproteobacteria bacterium]